MNIFYAHRLNNFEHLYVASSQYEKWLNYQDALLYVAMLEIDGYTDWNLPTGECLDRIRVMQNYDNIPKKFKLNKNHAYSTAHPNIMKIYNTSKKKLTTVDSDAVNVGWVRPVRMVK